MIVFGGIFSTAAIAQNYSAPLTAQWSQIGNKCFSCGSAYFMIYRESQPRSGWYYSYVYVWSNSYDSRGTLTNTYITRPQIWMTDSWGNNVQQLASSHYFLAAPQSSDFNGWNLLFTVWSTSPTAGFTLQFDGIDDY
jgi:hypothetical protein